MTEDQKSKYHAIIPTLMRSSSQVTPCPYQPWGGGWHRRHDNHVYGFV